MNDELKELYELASRALSCQAEFGHRELILEKSTLTHLSSIENAQPGETMVKTSSSIPKNDSKENLPVNETASKPIPDYGKIPPMETTTDLLTQSEDVSAPKYSDLESHREAICDCSKCPLGQTRTKFVYGVGNPRAKIMFIGEAPGRDEDMQGEPFVGRAGKLLDKIIAAIGFAREDVYIANILKCRPPNNRDPQPDEMNLCMPYLKEQIRLIKPQFICALGRIAVQGLLDTTAPLGSLRRKWHRFEGIPFLATYHPAALLRFAKYKRDTWEDMQVLMKEYERINNDDQ
ncbi:MAG: uracil-DNA glycosylase [candidate division Zixibacteria bacterium]